MGKPTSGVNARQISWEVLRRVQTEDAYVNLLLPVQLSQAGLSARDGAFATELTYGTLRRQLFYDWVIQLCSGRPIEKIQGDVLIGLRLGLHQLFKLRVPEHAAVNETVSLLRSRTNVGAAKFANAVMRQVLREGLDSFTTRLGEVSDPRKRLSVATSHPQWIISAYEQALEEGEKYGSDAKSKTEQIRDLLEANNRAPKINLVARPGLISLAELKKQVEGEGYSCSRTALSPWGLVMDGGDPGRLPSIRQHLSAVEDQGSQLVAALCALHPVEGKDESWLDLCAGPGGKAALMAALGAERGVKLIANEIAPHRADLVSHSVQGLNNVRVVNQDGREFVGDGLFDRVLVDAPCTGIGALRRHPESRYRQRQQVVSDLAEIQRQLLDHALDLTRGGGIVVYSTCSPHRSETISVLEAVLRRRSDFVLEDPTPTVKRLVDPQLFPDGVGSGKCFMQLWPHLHQADGMFAAVLRKQ